MHKIGADPKVKKTLVRNTEEKVRPSVLSARKMVIHDVSTSSSIPEGGYLQTIKELNEPTLCSSEVLANYLSGVKNSLPTSVSDNNKDLNAGQSGMGAKITKKLNFKFNDKIYKNLVELNADIDKIKTTRGKRPLLSSSNLKRDMEPNIEDFYQEDIDYDTAPNITVLNPKFKPIWRVEDGELHRLVATFDNL